MKSEPKVPQCTGVTSPPPSEHASFEKTFTIGDKPPHGWLWVNCVPPKGSAAIRKAKLPKTNWNFVNESHGLVESSRGEKGPTPIKYKPHLTWQNDPDYTGEN